MTGYLFHTLYIYIGETFLSCKDTLFSAHFPYQDVKNVLYIINLLWDICTYQNYYVPLQSS